MRYHGTRRVCFRPHSCHTFLIKKHVCRKTITIVLNTYYSIVSITVAYTIPFFLKYDKTIVYRLIELNRTISLGYILDYDIGFYE